MDRRLRVVGVVLAAGMVAALGYVGFVTVMILTHGLEPVTTVEHGSARDPHFMELADTYDVHLPVAALQQAEWIEAADWDYNQLYLRFPDLDGALADVLAEQGVDPARFDAPPGPSPEFAQALPRSGPWWGADQPGLVRDWAPRRGAPVRNLSTGLMSDATSLWVKVDDTDPSRPMVYLSIAY